MSSRAVCRTEFDDTDDLISALEGVYGKGVAKASADGLITLGNSCGRSAIFAKNKDGKYEMTYDSMNRSRLSELMPQKQSDGTIVNRLAQEYSRIKVGKALKTIRTAKISSQETDSDGNIRIKIKIKE